MKRLRDREDMAGAMESDPVEQGGRVRMTVLVLIRLALAVLVILMCSWAMAIAWAVGTQTDEAGLVQGPTFIHEVPGEAVEKPNIQRLMENV